MVLKFSRNTNESRMSLLKMMLDNNDDSNSNENGILTTNNSQMSNYDYKKTNSRIKTSCAKALNKSKISSHTYLNNINRIKMNAVQSLHHNNHSHFLTSFLSNAKTDNCCKSVLNKYFNSKWCAICNEKTNKLDKNLKKSLKQNSSTNLENSKFEIKEKPNDDCVSEKENKFASACKGKKKI